MALVYFTGVDEMANGSTDLNRFFTGLDTFSSAIVENSGGAFGGKRIRIRTSTSVGSLGASQRIGVAAGRANFAACWSSGPAPAGSTTTFSWGESGLNRSGVVIGRATGNIRLWLSGSLTAIVTFPVFSNPFWVEVGFLGGALQVYVNGILRFSYTMPEQNLQMGAILDTGGSGTNRDHHFDDLVFWNDEDVGDGFHTFPIGPQRIQTLQNRAPGSLAQWSPNAGPNWQDVNAEGWAGGAGVEAATVGLKDQHLVEPVAWNSARLRAIQPRISGMSLSEMMGSARLIGEVGSTAYRTDPVLLPYNSPEVLFGPVIPNPTAEDINAGEFGYESA